ncbi:MAG: ATP-binding protein [Desulfobacterales bacterium]|nr:ATP-binding protein [Desulfobacterales bacterium]
MKFRREFFFIIFVSFILFLVLSSIDAFELFFELSREYEQYELDEVFIFLPVLVFTLSAFLLMESRKNFRLNRTLKAQIGEKKATEKNLYSSKQFIEGLLESIPGGISVLNSDLTIRRTNFTLDKWYTKHAPLEGKKCYACFQDEVQPCEDCPAIRCIESGKFEHSVIQGPEDGPVYWREVFCTPIRDVEDGPVTGVVEFIQDISDRKKNEQRQQALEKRLIHDRKMEDIGNLAAGIAHDFNNILSCFFGSIQMAEKHAENPIKIKKYHENMRYAALRGSELVDQILTFSRRSNQEKSPISIKSAIHEAVTLLTPSISKSIEIELNLDSKSFVMANPTQVHQVIMNLCINASQAMGKAKGKITIELCDIDHQQVPPGLNVGDGEYILITVKDTGRGIAEKILDKIFDPYFTTKGEEGTGLGLATVYGIVKEHGGDIKVTSKEGRGTCFQVYLPVAK